MAPPDTHIVCLILNAKYIGEAAGVNQWQNFKYNYWY